MTTESENAFSHSRIPNDIPSDGRPTAPLSMRFTFFPGGQKLRTLLRATAALMIGLALVLALRRLDLRAFTEAIRHARKFPLLAAAVLSLANLGCKAIIWRIVLRDSAPVSLWLLFRYTVVAFAASVITPIRAGEMVRVWLLQRHHGIPYARSIGAAVAEKALDAFGILLFVAPLLWLDAPLKGWTRTAVFLFGIVGVGLTAASTLASRHVRGTGRIASFLRDIQVIGTPTVLLGAGVAALAASTFDFSVLWLSLEACGLRHDYAATAFVFLVTNAALALPTTPGNLGALEAAGITAVALLGGTRPLALAFVLLYHAVQLIPLFVVAIFNVALIRDIAAGPRFGEKNR